MEFFRKLRRVIWGDPPQDVKERRYLLKLDIFVLSYCCLIYWVNYLDRANLTNAYVSGMSEDLNMGKNEFNIINSCFYVGYLVAMIPQNLILLKIRPRFWLSFCAFAWGVLTLSMYKVTSYKQVCAIRFFVGIFESVTFAGTHLILSMYYEEHQLPIRTAIFTSSGLLGSLFSGVLQAAIYTNMHDVNGLKGWQWLFIIDFIITIPVVIYGLIFFPDSPKVNKPFYFTEEEHLIALSRMNKPHQHDEFNWGVLKRVFYNYRWYLFSLLWIMGGENESFATNGLFALWLKYYQYPISERNHYPMAIYAVGIFSTISSAIYIHNDLNGHWKMGVIIGMFVIIAPMVQFCKPYDAVSVFVAQYLSGVSYAGQAVFFSWANVICKHDLQERAVVLASMNMFSNAWNAWWSILFFSADTAPEFSKGCWALLSTAIASIILVLMIRYYQFREERSSGLIVEVENVSSDVASIEKV